MNALNPDDQQEQQQLNRGDRIVLGPIRRSAPEPLESATKTQLVTKSLNQEQSAVVGQRVGFERKL